MVLSSLTSSLTLATRLTGNVSQSGWANGRTADIADTVTLPLGTAAAPGAVGGANDAYHLLLTVPPSGSQTIDLNPFTNVGGDPAALFARVKGVVVRLLAATQLAPDGSTGTAASSIGIGGNFVAGASGQPITATASHVVRSGGFYAWGAGDAAGFPVTATTQDLLTVTNNDAGVAAKVLVTIIGGAT